jgi:ectoine hydroxylase-related dioxygenase (phytanoyl-CoA dioxygenase family)
MNPGDIAFFRPTTVHWSGPNHEGSVRRGFNCFYTGDPYQGWKDKLSQEEWDAMMEKKMKQEAKVKEKLGVS